VKLRVAFPNKEFSLLSTVEWKGKDVVFTIAFRSTQLKKRSRPIKPRFVVKTRVCNVNVGAADGNER
jgi:hypothetical protein